eukprot:984440-Lingulodinium_polyedra.AAC.2
MSIPSQFAPRSGARCRQAMPAYHSMHEAQASVQLNAGKACLLTTQCMKLQPKQLKARPACLQLNAGKACLLTTQCRQGQPRVSTALQSQSFHQS